ncbi:MAG: YccF domain-containing protein [Azospirillaceae bacterium]|nr:YccF domain-containing protein [Azospirillaceae bacterium]
MAPVSLLLNLLWLLFGGLVMALAWLFAALIMAVSIIGLPWARAALTMANYTLVPFGYTAISRRDDGGADLGTGVLGGLGNIIWLLVAGWWLALGHLLAALVQAVTIIGLPFAWAHLKLAALALWPIGKRIVSNAELESLRPGGRF